MRKYIHFSLILSVLVCSINAADFAGADWNMTMSEVSGIARKQSLTLLYENNDVLVYRKEVLGKECMCSYTFYNDALCQGTYLFLETYVNPNNYIYEYVNVGKLITRKYGTPVEDEYIWHDNLYKGDIDNYGTAVMLGHLSMIKRWDTEKTSIQQGLIGKQSEAHHAIIYKCKSFADDLENQEMEADLNDL